MLVAVDVPEFAAPAATPLLACSRHSCNCGFIDEGRQRSANAALQEMSCFIVLLILKQCIGRMQSICRGLEADAFQWARQTMLQ